MESWTWGDVFVYFMCTLVSIARTVPFFGIIGLLLKFPAYLLTTLPFELITEFKVTNFERRNPHRTYTTFFQFSALSFSRWVLRTFKPDAIQAIFFSDLHARILFKFRRFKYGTENVGDFDYTVEKTTVPIQLYEPLLSLSEGSLHLTPEQVSESNGYWVRSTSRLNYSPDLVIYFVPGSIAGCASPFLYLEFLSMMLVELQVQGFRNPAVYCLNVNYYRDAGMGFDGYVLEVQKGWYTACEKFPRAKTMFMGSGVGGTALLSLLLHMAKPMAGILPLPLKAPSGESEHTDENKDLYSDEEANLASRIPSSPSDDEGVDNQKQSSPSEQQSMLQHFSEDRPAPVDSSLPLNDNDNCHKMTYNANENSIIKSEDTRNHKCTSHSYSNDGPNAYLNDENSIVGEAHLTNQKISNSNGSFDSCELQECQRSVPHNESFNGKNSIDLEKDHQAPKISESFFTDENAQSSSQYPDSMHISNDLGKTMSSHDEATRPLLSKTETTLSFTNDSFEVPSLRQPDAILLISPLARVDCARTSKYPDFITQEALSHMNKIFNPKQDYVSPSSMPGCILNPEWWTEAIPSRGIAVYYGGNETQRQEIEQLIKVLRSASQPKVYVDFRDDEIHGWPITNTYTARTTTDQMDGITQVCNSISKMLVMDCIFANSSIV